ncbi:MAG: synthase subunit delta [Bacillota bacterium]|jgi:F-type H+-transporting ATPase subunit delta
MDSIASRYALALTKIAKESGQLVASLEVCQQALILFELEPAFTKFLANEFYTKEDKFKFIDRIFPENDWLFLGNFIKFTLVKHRINNVQSILKEAIESIQHELKTQDGIVYSVSPLTQEQISKLEIALKAYYGYPVTLQNLLKTDLIGGILLDIQGKVFDASMVEKLNNLRQRLLKRG